MKFKLLYHQGKNALVSWRLWVEGAEIHTEYGQVDGKKQHTMKLAKAKNVGRSNEVTPEKQAVIEARAMHKAKLDRKYSTTKSKAKDPVFLPMLAHDFEKRKKKVVYPVGVQPKLDGFRCLARRENGPVVLRSRSGKVLEIAHIREQLETIIAKTTPAAEFVLDGELYVHGVTFQQVTKLIKKYRPGETEDVEFRVYDFFHPEELDCNWITRIAGMDGFFNKCVVDPDSSIVMVPTTLAANAKEVYALREKYVADGYEGAIVREFDGTYELGHRSQHLLKCKTFKDEEYEIVGFYEGVGRYLGCVTWICKTPKGQEFHVCPKGTLKAKRYWFTNGDQYLHRMLKVKYFELSEKGVPRFPVGLGIRDPE